MKPPQELVRNIFEKLNAVDVPPAAMFVLSQINPEVLSEKSKDNLLEEAHLSLESLRSKQSGLLDEDFLNTIRLFIYVAAKFALDEEPKVSRIRTYLKDALEVAYLMRDNLELPEEEIKPFLYGLTYYKARKYTDRFVRDLKIYLTAHEES